MENDFSILKIKPVDVSDYLNNLKLDKEKNIIISDSTYFLSDCDIIFFKSVILDDLYNFFKLLKPLHSDGLIMIDNSIKFDMDTIKKLCNLGYKIVLVEFIKTL